MTFLTLILLVLADIQQSMSHVKISPGLVSTFKLFAEYSAAAYCLQNYLIPPGNSSVCPADVCDEVQDVVRLHAFNGTSSSSAFAILTLDHSRELITMSFRGTVTNEDWQTNINTILMSANAICEGCWAHAGFLGDWEGERDNIVGFWKLARELYPSYETLVTGHSLGGALATLCALEFRKVDPAASVRLFTYGAPRVGDDTFATFVQTTLGDRGYRVTHLNDPVPRLPGKFLGYRHPFPEYHITSPHIPHVLTANESVLTMPANLVVKPEDILVLDRSESEDGNAGYDCSNIEMHDAYFIDISKCATGADTPLLGDFAERICDVLDICCSG